MPASTLDSVDAALRSSFASKADVFNGKVSSSVKQSLLPTVEFESAGTFQNCIIDNLKTKYIILKPREISCKTFHSTENSDYFKHIDEPEDSVKLSSQVLFPMEQVELGWNKKDWNAGSGMINMGNTCYLNSTLQALFHVPAFANWLITDSQCTPACQESGGLCIICAMRRTLKESQENLSPIRPLLIYNKLRLVCRNLIPGRQEDAHEFLRHLVEAMEKAYLSRFKNHTEFDSKIKETTPLNQILGGYLRSTVRCLKCSHVSTTFQHFQDLLLDIRKAQALDEALDGYFCREKLDDDSYNCQACKKKVPATKQFSVERPPMVLCIQLKRFSISNNKITKHLNFRQRLDLTKYARHNSAVPLSYKLTALVTHMGPTVNCGHYTAVAQASSGSFYQFDDSMVRVIPHQTVFNTNAYIMFYELEKSALHLKSTAICKFSNESLPSCSTSMMDNNSSNNNVYGPQLPPLKKQNISVTLMNGNCNGSNSSITVDNSINGTDKESHKKSVTSVNDSGKNGLCRNGTITLKSIANSNNTTKTCNQDTVLTKLVPYETDDSSCSEDSSKLQNHKQNGTKEWKNSVSNRPPLAVVAHENNNWSKMKYNSQTTNELLKLSHNGYSAPVSTWNGGHSQINQDVNYERNIQKQNNRKRTMNDDAGHGNAKHLKKNNYHPKSNPRYNPIQEFHMRSWNRNHGNGHFKQFYNRHRRKFNQKYSHKFSHRQ